MEAAAVVLYKLKVIIDGGVVSWKVIVEGLPHLSSDLKWYYYYYCWRRCGRDKDRFLLAAACPQSPARLCARWQTELQSESEVFRESMETWMCHYSKPFHCAVSVYSIFSGHEAAFAAFLCCLCKVGALRPSDQLAIVFKVFNRWAVTAVGCFILSSAVKTMWLRFFSRISGVAPSS